jgi:hypothetical protein
VIISKGIPEIGVIAFCNTLIKQVIFEGNSMLSFIGMGAFSECHSFISVIGYPLPI